MAGSTSTSGATPKVARRSVWSRRRTPRRRAPCTVRRTASWPTRSTPSSRVESARAAGRARVRRLPRCSGALELGFDVGQVAAESLGDVARELPAHHLAERRRIGELRALREGRRPAAVGDREPVMRGAERSLRVPCERRVRGHLGDRAVLLLGAELARGGREGVADLGRAVRVLRDREPVTAPLAVSREVAAVLVLLVSGSVDLDVLL